MKSSHNAWAVKQFGSLLYQTYRTRKEAINHTIYNWYGTPWDELRTKYGFECVKVKVIEQ